jgi:hypothetical protein
MRSRLLFLLVIVIVFTVAFSIPKAPARALKTLQQAATTCKDDKLVKMVGTDLQANFGALKDINKADSDALVVAINAQRDLRQKYEDLDLPQESACIDLLYYVIVTESSTSDLLVLLLEAKQNLVKDKDAYQKDLDKQLARFQKNLNDLAVTVGVATPTP